VFNVVSVKSQRDEILVVEKDMNPFQKPQRGEMLIYTLEVFGCTLIFRPAGACFGDISFSTAVADRQYIIPLGFYKSNVES
jgi:hypothetical protein